MSWCRANWILDKDQIICRYEICCNKYLWPTCIKTANCKTLTWINNIGKFFFFSQFVWCEHRVWANTVWAILTVLQMMHYYSHILILCEQAKNTVFGKIPEKYVCARICSILFIISINFHLNSMQFVCFLGLFVPKYVLCANYRSQFFSPIACSIVHLSGSFKMIFVRIQLVKWLM